jgi:hypothetical protein
MIGSGGSFAVTFFFFSTFGKKVKYLTLKGVGCMSGHGEEGGEM